VGINRKSVDDLNYGVCFLRTKRPVVFVDFHHSKDYKDDPRFAGAISALYRFKDKDAGATEAFAQAGALAASDNFGNARLTAVVPVMGSSETRANANSRNYPVAAAIAEALGVDVDTTLFSQTARNPMHVDGLGTDGRRERVAGSVQCGDATGQRILLVDDVFTTGATLEAYEQAIVAAGGFVVGAVVLMKYENDEDLMNPGLF
jgi:predicted amidophosphoribosyltransferase